MNHEPDLHISIHKIMLSYLTSSEYLRLWGISSASQCSRTTASVRGNVLKCLRVAGVSNVKQLVVRSNSVPSSLYNLQRSNSRPNIRERCCHAPL